MPDGTILGSDGLGIAYRDHGGQGRGVVLLHGGGANLESMDQFAERLGPSRHVVAMDIRACGHSDDPPRFRLTDAADDVAALVDALELGHGVDVIGHSMGGFVAGFFGSAHPAARVVSIDGFGPGMIRLGSDADKAEFRGYQAGLLESFMTMTAPPELGDRAWRDAQVELLCEVLPRIGYTAPNVRAMVERNFVDLGGGLFQRRPPRHLFVDAFEEDGDKDILRMYRGVQCPTLIIRCTQSGAPDTLDAELAQLVADNPLVEVSHLPLTHMAPAWDAIDEVVDELERFLTSHPAG